MPQPTPATSSVPATLSPNQLRERQERRNTLIAEYYPMVRRVAYKMVRSFPRCVDADDLIHIGIIGLMDALDKFEENRADSFRAYARMRVQGAILDEMRKNDWVPRSVRDRAARLTRARHELTDQLGRDPSHDELARFLGVSTDRLDELMRTADVRVLVSTEEGNDDEGTVGDTLKSEAEDLFAIIERRDMDTSVRDAVGMLSDRDRVIVDLYYYRDLTFKEIAGVLGVTESRVSQLHTRLKARLREHLEAKIAS